MRISITRREMEIITDSLLHIERRAQWMVDNPDYQDKEACKLIAIWARDEVIDLRCKLREVSEATRVADIAREKDKKGDTDVR